MTITTKYYTVTDPSTKAYWDVEDVNLLLSHHADVNVAMSPRNYGKSFAGRVKSHQFMDKGETVGWNLTQIWNCQKIRMVSRF